MNNKFIKICKKTSVFVLTFIMFLLVTVTAYAQPDLPAPAESAILVERSTGKILYKYNENKKIYPASTTKLMTAVIALEYIEPNEIITLGDEIYKIPADSSKAHHVEGESITVENLIRALLIQSGNETACSLARAVAEKRAGVALEYDEAEKAFCTLMNDKATELGAMSTHFTNPHGYHSEDHYTTAYDMILIAKEAMDNELIRKVVSEVSYEGDSVDDERKAGLLTQHYEWETHNEILLQNDYYYEYATGMKTGYTKEAGSCLVGSAEKDGIELISAVFLSTDTDRWVNTKFLFEYGFNMFGYEIIAKSGTVLETLKIANPRLGDEDETDIYINESHEEFLSKEELEKITHEIEYNKDFFYSPNEEGKAVENADATMLSAPISKGSEIGTITYYLDGEEIFKTALLTKDEILERTSKSDFDYYSEKVKAFAFSSKAIPFWIGGGVIILIIIILIINLIRKRKRRRSTFLNRRY